MNITDDEMKEVNRRTRKTVMIVAFVIAVLITIFFISPEILLGLAILAFASVGIYLAYEAIHSHHTLNVLEEKLEKEYQETHLKNQDLISKKIDNYRKTHVKGE